MKARTSPGCLSLTFRTQPSPQSVRLLGSEAPTGIACDQLLARIGELKPRVVQRSPVGKARMPLDPPSDFVVARPPAYMGLPSSTNNTPGNVWRQLLQDVVRRHVKSPTGGHNDANIKAQERGFQLLRAAQQTAVDAATGMQDTVDVEEKNWKDHCVDRWIRQWRYLASPGFGPPLGLKPFKPPDREQRQLSLFCSELATCNQVDVG
jgi:hypothetical protein